MTGEAMGENDARDLVTLSRRLEVMYVLPIKRIRKMKYAIHEPRVHSAFSSSIDRDCFSPWLMLLKMIMRMTPSTMSAVPWRSDVVNAVVRSTFTTHASRRASTRT